MKKHYECQPYDKRYEPLIFDWDEETGEVTGPSAKHLIDGARAKSQPIHPVPMSHTLSKDPLKSKVDMAVLVGYWHHLPEDLEPYYPKWEPSKKEKEIMAQGGQITY